MSTELICPIHGPYDAAYGSCPYCSGSAGRPAAPRPLDDDMPTDIGGGGGGEGWDDDMPTDIGYGSDTDFGDKTDIGRSGGRSSDETELDWDLVDEGPMALLWVKNGRRRGQTYTIKDGDKVGRTDGNIILDDPKISNPHARFRFADDTFTLWDFGSKNGTLVNGTKIKSATDLKENDEIKFGDTTYVFKMLE